MSGLLLGARFAAEYGKRIDEIEAANGVRWERIRLPTDPKARLADDVVARIELAFLSADVVGEWPRAFFAAVSGAKNLRWLHVLGAGLDHPVFERFFERGVSVTNSPGVSARPIARSAITGMLVLARDFPRFAELQRQRMWAGFGSLPTPTDLEEQTLVVLGLGSIGCEIARLAKALGLHAIGVRRSPKRSDDPVDELVTPEKLAEILPRADWLAIACPLTDQTRGLLDTEALARLPAGARILNVGRGAIVDESAMIAALERGQLAGAYLDVFEVEPLPESSPLWTLPNVIVTPHASSLSAGSGARQAEAFLANLERWARGEPLVNIVK